MRDFDLNLFNVSITANLFEESTEVCTKIERLQFGFVQPKVGDTIVIEVHEKRNFL